MLILIVLEQTCLRQQRVHKLKPERQLSRFFLRFFISENRYLCQLYYTYIIICLGKNYICNDNRNNNIPLCGECLNGYSPAFGTNKCVKCNKNN